MADRARCDLPYGHFGRGIYSLEDHSWHFQRTLAFASNTQQLSEPKLLSQPSRFHSVANHGADQKGPLAKRHQKQVKALADFNPHLRPASGMLPPLLRVSEAIDAAVRRHDSLKGSMVASGDIQSHSRNRPIPVAAYVAGKTGCDLCIVQVQKQKRGWDDDRRYWLEVPSLQGEPEIWSSHGGPIQQVYFASNAQPGPALLAVRLLTKTAVMRATQVKTPSEEISGSSISTNVLYNVDIQRTGGNVHADVTFNPWFPQQIALVDINGQWTVLEFSARNMGQVARTWSKSAQKASDGTASSINDGWARIAWVLNLGTIAVCTRESLTLFSIAEDIPTVIETVELGLSGAVPWVLDFLVLPGRREHICVLTSTHILVYKLAEMVSSQKTASISFKIRHYKNPEDLSLRLAVWKEDNDEDFGLLMYSSQLGLTSCYRLTISETHPAMTADQMAIHLPATLARTNKTACPVSIEVKRIEMAHKPRMTASERPFRSARFFSALVVREGLGAYQTLFCMGADANVPTLTWEAKLVVSSFKLSRPRFVVEDSTLDLEIPARDRAEPSARRLRRAKLQPTPSSRTVLLEQITKLLQSPAEGPEPFADVLASVKSELVRSDLEVVPPMRTLYSFAQAELDVSDIESFSAALDLLLQSRRDRMNQSPGPLTEAIEHEQHLTLAAIPLPSALGLKEMRLDADLSLVYDRTLALWIAPLSEDIPGRIRLAKAKLCGLVAAQLVLASRSLRIEDPPENEASQEQTQSQSQIPYSQASQISDDHPGGHRSFALSQLDSSQPFHSSALPTPSQTPSITTASTRPSTFAAPELHRLSKYAAFSKPPPHVLPRSLNNVLSHWKVGEDVNDYDWMSTTRRLTRQDDDADDDMTETERRRAQRRAERHMRRQRKEAAASQAQQLASSQAPQILSASQPVGLNIESQPSGVPASSQFTVPGVGAAAASQVEAGRFGGRPAVAAGKKRRRQGF